MNDIIAKNKCKEQNDVVLIKNSKDKLYEINYGFHERSYSILDDAVREFANCLLHQLECANHEDITAV